MASLSPDEFEQEILKICSSSTIVKSIAQTRGGQAWLELRAYLPNNAFVNIFYNQETDKKSFALIQAGKRILAVDNAKGDWHWHPLEDPSQHRFVEQEISFAEFLQQVETHLTKP